ncbi:MAG: phosphotransferase [Ktedonobacterales bacterium]|nr:phosphotransferase [Ktedonobacterales bacterium]
MAVETGVGMSGALGGKDFFAQTRLDLSTCATSAEGDAALGALILRYLRHMYDGQGAWPGHDGRDTLRQTCHAVEVLHHLNFDNSTADMVYHAGNWLINLAIAYSLPSLERQQVRLYPSRFKTLAYLGRFDDEQVRRDFSDLLSQETDGMIGDIATHEAGGRDQATAESDMLRTCIALDTLLTLDRSGKRKEICADERYTAIVGALRDRLRAWKPSVNGARPSGSRATIGNHRDLSYVLGLLRHARRSPTPRQTEPVVIELVGAIDGRDRTRFSDIGNVLYAALQLAEHFRADARVERTLHTLLEDLRTVYAEAEAPRRWEFANHALVLRLLLTYYGPETLVRGMAARLLIDAERLERITLESDLQAVIRDRMLIALGPVRSLSGGFTDDQILHVPFTYWFSTAGRDGTPRVVPSAAPEASLIIKRSTSSAFHTATTNYGRLPAQLHHFFIRQPSRSEVFKSAHSPAYYLPMEDLTDLLTFRDILDELDQRAMGPQQIQLVRQASTHIAEASFALFRETRTMHVGFPSTQIARLYLARIESALVHAVSRVPWLKTALDGYTVSGQRFKGLDYYLGMLTRQAHALQPCALGLVHGDFHTRNIMLDRHCTSVKLIDLDKLSWSGDYLADLGNLLADVAIYRRLVEPDREFGLPPEDITFISKTAEPGTAENAIHYPALGRRASLHVQEQLLQHITAFASELEDTAWKPRLWLATATALFFRIAHHTEKEIAAVLYGEAVRLLHELARSLESGQPLPALLVPDAWPEPPASRSGARGDLPEWLTRHAALRKIHDGLRAFGLRFEIERETVRYVTTPPSDGPCAVLVPARREGIARLLLRVPTGRAMPTTALQVVHNVNAGDALGTIVIIPQDVEVAEVLRLVRAGIER